MITNINIGIRITASLDNGSLRMIIFSNVCLIRSVYFSTKKKIQVLTIKNSGTYGKSNRSEVYSATNLLVLKLMNGKFFEKKIIKAE